MSSSTLYRLSGLALLLGGVISAVLYIVSAVAFPSTSSGGFDPKVVSSAPWLIVNLLTAIAGVLILLGFPGAYLRQAKQTGAMGLIGFILLLIVSLMLDVIIYIADLLILPWLASVAPKLVEGNGPTAVFVFFIAAVVFLTLGALLFAISTLRARVLPRMAAIELLVAVAITLVTIAPLPSALSNILGTASPVLFNLALAWFGFALLTERAQAPAPAQPLVASSHGGAPA